LLIEASPFVTQPTIAEWKSSIITTATTTTSTTTLALFGSGGQASIPSSPSNRCVFKNFLNLFPYTYRDATLVSERTIECCLIFELFQFAHIPYCVSS
jgi:hypothetical protein